VSRLPPALDGPGHSLHRQHESYGLSAKRRAVAGILIHLDFIPIVTRAARVNV